MPNPFTVDSGQNRTPVWEVDQYGNTYQSGGVELAKNTAPTPTRQGYLQLFSPDGEGLTTVDAAGNQVVISGGASSGGGTPSWLNVKNFGAKGDNTTDDTTDIQNALNAAGNDGIVYFPPGSYRTTKPLLLPPGVTMLGFKQRRPRNSFMSDPNLGDAAVISPRSTFSGAAVILVQDTLSGGWSTMAQGSAIIGIMLSCAALPAGDVDGIQVYGQVQGLVLDNVAVLGPSGYCFNFATNASVSSGPSNPFSLRVRGCFATGGGTATTLGGYFVYNCTDSTFSDCETIATGGDGWVIEGGSNSHFVACRSENNTGNGFSVQATAGATAASVDMVGCSTNGNSGHGFNITKAQTVVLTDCTANGEGASSAGFNIATSSGVTVLNECTSPAGATSEYGLQLGSSNIVVVNGGVFYGTTAGIHDTGADTLEYIGPNVVQLTGTATAPTASVSGVVTSGTLGGSLTVPGVLTAGSLAGGAVSLNTSPTDQGLKGWAYDPISVRTGVAPSVGVLNLIKVKLPVATSITNVVVYINALGTLLTSGENFVGLYSSNGTLLGTSADQTAAWGSTGVITAALTGGPFTAGPGFVWVAILSNGSAAPQFGASANLNGTLVNGPVAAGLDRFATQGTGLVALPTPTITVASNTATGNAWWAAVE